jgi:hypothetical protein
MTSALRLKKSYKMKQVEAFTRSNIFYRASQKVGVPQTQPSPYFMPDWLLVKIATQRQIEPLTLGFRFHVEEAIKDEASYKGSLH